VSVAFETPVGGFSMLFRVSGVEVRMRARVSTALAATAFLTIFASAHDASGFWHVATNWSANPLLPGPSTPDK